MSKFLTSSRRGESSGFTLIELLVVIGIIGVLASVVLASLNSARRKSRDARRVSDIKQLQLALELYFDSNSNAYAPALADLAANNCGGTPCIPTVPVDPINVAPNVYTYERQGTTSYVLRAVLEDRNAILNSDVDGTVGTVVCDDAVAPFQYCARP